MASVHWWKLNTDPGEPCRNTARTRGWIWRLFPSATPLPPKPAPAGGPRLSDAVARTILALALLTGLAARPEVLHAQTPAAASDATVNPEQVLECMETRIAAQQAALQSVHQLRQYHAENKRLRKQADLLVEFDYLAPDKKSFRVVERSGSASVHKRVFDPMMKAESETGPAEARKAAEINRQNYGFRYLGLDEGAFQFEAQPRTPSRYLFRGRVWIDPGDCAVRRIEGEPAQRPSFWVHKTHFVHQYGKFGQFWFPLSNRTEVELRLLGRSEFSIEYFDHTWQERAGAHADPSVKGHSGVAGPGVMP